MLVSHSKKFVMVSVPKTGSTSLHYSFSEKLGGRYDSQSGSPAIYHIYAEDIRYFVGSSWQDYYSCAVVRNPYDRLVSLFHDFKSNRGFIKAGSFDDFVLNKLKQNWIHDIHFKPQIEFVTDRDGTLIIDDVFRFEDGVQEIFSYLCGRLSLPLGKVGHARKGKRDEFTKYYSNKKVIDIVNSVYEKDFELFGYDKL